MFGNTPCSCGGSNENCFRCSGTGAYTPRSVSAPTLSTCPMCGQPVSSKNLTKHIRKVHGEVFGTPTPKFVKPKITRRTLPNVQINWESPPTAIPCIPMGWKLVCVQCGFRALTSSDIDKHHYRCSVAPRTKPLQTQHPREVKHPEGPQNPVKHQRSESRYDGSRDYYDNYREDHNKLGSHPTHDDYGDESGA